MDRRKRPENTNEEIPAEIVRFLEAHHIFTLATGTDEGFPYCASLFYLYLKERAELLFISRPDSRHIRELRRDDRVAGTIHHETRTIQEIQGVQFLGRAAGTKNPELTDLYLERFPEAHGREGSFYRIHLEWIKFTSNRTRFGEKTIWEREA